MGSEVAASQNAPPTVSISLSPSGTTFTVPAEVTITATAADSDGVISKVEFFDGTALISTDFLAPYSYKWHALAGTHSLTAKAWDNLNAVTVSQPINITVESMPDVPPDGFPCPPRLVTRDRTVAFETIGDQVLINFAADNFGSGLSPCEQITFDLRWELAPEAIVGVWLELYNYKGQMLYNDYLVCLDKGHQVFPLFDITPWTDSRAQVAIPAYAIFRTDFLMGPPANYQLGYTRQPRRANGQPYNLGGDSFSNAPLALTPSTYYGSIYGKLREGNPVTDPGQYFKVHLEGGEGFFVSGYATGPLVGPPSSMIDFRVEVYDAALLPFQSLSWVRAAGPGRNTFKSEAFINPSPAPADFYIRVQTARRPVYDFELNIERDTSSCALVEKPVAPDAVQPVPYTTAISDYKIPATLDPDVLAPGDDLVPDDPTITGRETELWARVYHPMNLSGGPFPLLIFLHGNHPTCGKGVDPRIDYNSRYTFYGRCAEGDIETPNHEGYTYLGELFASMGYLVVSINANRGITGRVPGPPDDPTLILARGKLVLKHLQQLSEWHVDGGSLAWLGIDLRGKIDFNNVALLGHSRGGQGVRAAYVLYNDPGSPWPSRILRPVNIRAIFEIGPTDFPTLRLVSGEPVTSNLEATGTKWNVLLPMCDGDVNTLEGVRPFDRAMARGSGSPAAQKSTYAVWGAIHNFFNLEWQTIDRAIVDPDKFYEASCIGGGNVALFTPYHSGSPKQLLIGTSSVMALFRANLGAPGGDIFNQNFNPLYKLPATVDAVTRVDRGFTPSPAPETTTVFEDFTRPPGTDYCGSPNICSGPVTVINDRVPNHDSSIGAGHVRWTSSGTGNYFQSNWEDAGSGKDISDFQTLDFRVSRSLGGMNPPTATDFSVQLVMADGNVSNSLSMCEYHGNLKGPVGGWGYDPSSEEWVEQYRPIMETVRIPLADFTSADLTQVRGVRFVFDGTLTGAIYLANVRFTK